MFNLSAPASIGYISVHERALKCALMGVYFSALGIIVVYFSALGSWECTSVHSHYGSVLQCTVLLELLRNLDDCVHAAAEASN